MIIKNTYLYSLFRCVYLYMELTQAGNGFWPECTQNSPWKYPKLPVTSSRGGFIYITRYGEAWELLKWKQEENTHAEVCANSCFRVEIMPHSLTLNSLTLICANNLFEIVEIKWDRGQPILSTDEILSITQKRGGTI